MNEKTYTFFWGCTIPSRFSFMEKATRLIAENLQIEIRDPAGFTCCPERALVASIDEDLWLYTAARNLAIAEEEGFTVVTPCNGCYSVFKTVIAELHKNPGVLFRINKELEGEGLNYKGRVRVLHLLEALLDDIGIVKLKGSIKRPLRWMKIAAHPGCHLVRPSKGLDFDDPIFPKKYDLLIKALGAIPVDYKNKMFCCGGGLTNVGMPEDGKNLVRRKLLELSSLGVDALVTSCPSCFNQFDIIQATMIRAGEGLGIPVITLSELIGLAMGLDHKELGLEGHRVSPSLFLEKFEKVSLKEEPSFLVDIETIKRCVECGACKDDCPICFEGVDLHGIMKSILEEPIDSLLMSPDIWRCVECHTCVEMCPQVFGMEKAIKVLKHMAIEKGVEPKQVKKTKGLYLKTGRIGEIQKRERKRLGLPDIPESQIEGWKILRGKIQDS